MAINKNFASIYSKFRGSTWFLLILLGVMGIWLTLHFLVGTDRDLGGLNLFLSFEASVSLAFFTMVSDAQTAEAKKQTDRIEQILQMMDQRDQKIMEVVEDIHEDVDKEERTQRDEASLNGH